MDLSLNKRKEGFRINDLTKLYILIVFSYINSLLPLNLLFPFFLSILVFALCLKVNLFKELLKIKIMFFFILLMFFTYYLTTRNILTSLSETIKFLNLFSLSILFIIKVDVLELSVTLAHYLRPILSKLSIKLASLVLITISFIPIVFKTSHSTLNAFISRASNKNHHYISLITLFFSTLFMHLIKTSEEFEDALISRNFNMEKERSYERIHLVDIILVVCLTLLIVLIKLK